MSLQDATARPIPYRTLRALSLALALIAALAAATVLGRLAAGDGVKTALRSASALEARKLAGPSGLDSWGAMLSALHRQQSGGSIYAAAMLLDNCKYQYPPAALLLMEALPHPQGAHLCSRDAEAGAEPTQTRWPFKAWIDLVSRASLLVTCWLGFVLLRQGLAAPDASPRAADLDGATQRRLAAALTVALGLSFFPLVWGHTLGQVQVQINLALGAALCALLAGRPALAGVLLGLCCLFKPNYALFVVWALLRKEWRMTVALVAVAAVGHGLALWRYGVTAHVEYIDFLRGLGRLGESYWANQSLTGLLHRWFDPGSALQWADSAFGSSAHAQRLPPEFDWATAGFPAYRSSVYLPTVAFSIGLMLVAFWPARGAGRPSPPLARTLDLGLALAAITIASPIVWLHHYGSFFALFALALAATLRAPADNPRALRPGLLLAGLAVAYALLGSVMLQPERIFTDRAGGVLGSHGWAGALMLTALLWLLRRRWASEEPAQRM